MERKAVSGIMLTLLLIGTLGLVFNVGLVGAGGTCGGDSPRDAPKEKRGISTASPQQLGFSSSGTEFSPSTDADPWVKFKVNEGWDLDQYLFKESSPIDFYIDVDDFKPDPTISPKPKLTLRVWDVDFVAPVHPPERDLVKINNNPLGYLTGANDQWSIVTFDVEPSFIVEGNNHIQVDIDVLGDGWAVTVDFGELKIPFNIKVTKIEATEDINIRDNAGNPITDPIWETTFDSNGRLVHPPSRDYPIADWFKSSSFKFKVTVDAWPKKPPSLTPEVHHWWMHFKIVGTASHMESNVLRFTGWEGEYEVELPQEVGQRKINQVFTFWKGNTKIQADPAQVVVHNKLYVTLEKPRADVYPPKERWLEVATEWAAGAATSEKVAEKVVDKERSNPFSWVYKDGGANWEKMIDTTPGDKANCYVFARVWQKLTRVLGLSSSRSTYSPGVRFITSTKKALDNNNDANAKNMATGNRDRWSFTSHCVGRFNGKYYDPTFGLKGYTNPEENVEYKDTGNTVTEAGVAYRVFQSRIDPAKKIKVRGTPTQTPNGWSIDEYKNPVLQANNSTGAIFTGRVTDSGLDTDGDGLSNYLMANIEINVTEADNYNIDAILKFDNTTISISSLSLGLGIDFSAPNATLFMNTGIHEITIYFSGRDIYEAGINGNYTIDAILNRADNQTDAKLLNTSFYNCTQFQGLTLDVINMTDFGSDTDGDGNFDLLTVKVDFDVLREAFYEIDGFLLGGGKLIDSTSNSSNLVKGTMIVFVNFNGSNIRSSRVNGPYNLELSLADENYDRIVFYNTSSYSYTQFEKPSAEFTGTYSDYGADIDSDGLYDSLVIEIGLNVTDAGNYGLFGWLYDYNGSFMATTYNNTYLDVGIKTVLLNFDGTSIYRHKINGPYNLKHLRLYDAGDNEIDSMENAYNTSAYNYKEFQRPVAEFTDVYSDYGTDTDANGLYDYLTVDVSINVTKAGNYTIEGALYESNSSLIVWATNESYLSAGAQLITLNFNGIIIYSNGADGPYNLKNLRLYDEAGSITDARLDAYNTTAYNYTYFERPPIALTGIFYDYGIDTDADGFYDYLVVEIEVMVAYNGTYEVNARLMDIGGNEIVWASNSTYLYEDVPQTIQLHFDGRYIFANGVNGSYFVKDLSIYYSTFSLYVLDLYTTSTYNYTDFQKSAIILGTVTDENAVPIPNALVYVSGVDYEYTNINGSYKLIILQTGTYTVEVTPPPGLDLLGNSTTVDVTIGETTILNFVLHTKPPDLAVSLEAPAFLKLCTPFLLNATVRNTRMRHNETNVELQLLINGGIVNSVIITELQANTSYMISYLWTPTVDGIYNVTAYAPPVPEEDPTANNVASVSVSVWRPYTRTYLPNEWIGGGTPMSWHGDDSSWPYPLPFNFSFYGANYTTIYPSSNGLITFLSPDTSFSNSISALAGKLAIAPAWDDWVTYAPYDIYIWQNSTHVGIRWYVRAYGSNIVSNFEAVLRVDGAIQFNYGYNNGSVSATIGVSNGAGDILAEDVTNLNYTNTIVFTSYFIGMHDVAVANVTPSKTVVGQGYSVAINVPVENQGCNTETFNVTAYYQNSTGDYVIGTQTGVTLASGANTTLTFTWDTSGVKYAVYTIKANATVVPGETDTGDNSYTDGQVTVTIPGDIDGDGYVYVLDLALLGGSWRKRCGQLNYNPNADIDCDGYVYVLDLALMGGNWRRRVTIAT